MVFEVKMWWEERPVLRIDEIGEQRNLIVTMPKDNTLKSSRKPIPPIFLPHFQHQTTFLSDS